MAYHTSENVRSRSERDMMMYPGGAVSLNNGGGGTFSGEFVDPESATKKKSSSLLSYSKTDKNANGKDKSNNSISKKKNLMMMSKGLKYGGMFLLLCVLMIASRTSATITLVFLASVGTLAFAKYLSMWVLEKDEGTMEMIEVADAIRAGASGFFSTQYGLISKLAVLCAALVFFLYEFRQVTPEQEKSGLTSHSVAILTTLAFLLGAFCSGMSGYAGMWVSVRANSRVAAASRRGSREPLVVALRAGGFAALLVVATTVLGVASLFAVYSWWYGLTSAGMKAAAGGGDSASESIENIIEIPLMLVGYGFGASFVALFAQLGGGIYTKAADVGADLCGKVEMNIPEDDPRNPAVIADLVGDNVGDCAARGADLFESIAAEIISAMILGATVVRRADMSVAEARGFVLFPLVVHAMDCFASALGILSVSDVEPRYKQEPYSVLKRGYNVALAIAVVCFGIACKCMLYTEKAEDAWKYFYTCGLVGIVCGYCFVFIAQFYTDYAFPAVRKIAEASTTGSGTNVIAGVGVGLEATAAPVIVVSIAVVAAYHLGQNAGLVDDSSDEPIGGLFGTAVATMGMLSTAAYVLTMDVFGPIADNAGGIVEMSNQPDSVRDVCDELDAVGNTTKATTKGYAIGSAALASFLLFSAFMDEVSAFTGQAFSTVDICIPEVFIIGLLGSMLVYLFSSYAIAAVGNSAQDVVKEVRRQFAENPGIMTYDTKPDYERCVSIVAKSALRGMVKPGVVAVSGPLITGVIFRHIGIASGRELLGAKCVASFLMFATASGILMALFLNTAGGAWDNAKKYVETGFGGGKGSETHKAAVTGDTVGDPFKDTAGPSIHVLIKMLATITLVAAPMFLD
jgi:H(+)-translocating pyrophosphatase